MGVRLPSFLSANITHRAPLNIAVAQYKQRQYRCSSAPDRASRASARVLLPSLIPFALSPVEGLFATLRLEIVSTSSTRTDKEGWKVSQESRPNLPFGPYP